MRLLRIALIGAAVVAGLAYGLPASVIESAYSRGIYPFIAFLLGSVSDAVPFSIAEVLAGLIVIVMIYVPIRILRTGGPDRLTIGERLRRLLGIVAYTTVVGACLGFVAFQLLWGLNYHRVPLETRIGWNEANLARTNFVARLEEFATRASKERSIGPLEWSSSVETATVDALDQVVARLDGAPVFCARRPKTLFVNGYFAALGIHGITIPFTHEAHHRSDLFDFERPFVVAHERAHLAGYAPEAEANFVAYHACIVSRDPLARYSALLRIYGHFRNAASPEERVNADAKLSPAVKADLVAIATRNRNEQSKLQEVSRSVNDSYLKANAVAEGVGDYGRVVKLLLGVPFEEPE